MPQVHVIQDFPQPVEQIFGHLAEHESLEPLFGAKIKRLADGTDGIRNGVGSSRSSSCRSTAVSPRRSASSPQADR